MGGRRGRGVAYVAVEMGAIGDGGGQEGLRGGRGGGSMECVGMRVYTM